MPLRKGTVPGLGATPTVAMAVAAAWALKRHYSQAGPDELAWILAPTAALVEIFTGGSFTSEAGVGQVSRELRYVIAPSCAGVNFLIAAFVALVATTMGRGGWMRSLVRLLPCAAAAYSTAVVANAARIWVAVWIHRQPGLPPWVAGEPLHRLLGVAIYLVFLFGLCAGARRLARRRVAGPWIPAACYLGITVLVPLANGGWSRPGFAWHAAVVSSAVLACLVLRALALRQTTV